MKNLFYILLLTSFLSNAQITLIPDPNFEQALIDQNIDSDGIINGQVATADISSLTFLSIQGANITNATGIEDFISLTGLTLKGNANLTSIDVSNLTQLLVLDLRNNNLSSLDVSNIAGLLDLRALGNQLTTIDLSSNTQLNNVLIQSNSLESLNIKNGMNTNISGGNFKANNNPNLNCIQVDNVAYSTSNWTTIDASVVFRTDNCAITLIPDTNFEQALIGLGYDSDGVINGRVFTGDINTRTSLVVPSKNISDATGIEDFIALEELLINNNNLTSIDVSNLQQLKLFRGTDNPSLTNFIHGNNPNIESLFLIDTDINAIDVTSFSLLAGLYLSNTSISQLDVSNNLNLFKLRIDGTNISQIDVSNNSQLNQFYGQNTLLIELNLSNNSGLVSIKVSSCPNLNTLNVKNGNNTNVNTFEAQNNPNLFCIQVDNDAYSTTNWTTIDPQIDFSTSCAYTLIPDTNFEQVLIDLGIDSEGIINGKVYTKDINTITTLDIPSKNISDLTGIEEFSALKNLYIYGNDLIDIDISTLLFLEILNIGDNNLMSLDISNSQQLKQLLAGGNSSLVNFIYSNNTNLYNINLSGSIITTIDISQFPLLSKLSLSNTLFTELNLNNNSNLTEIIISNCPSLNTLNVKNGSNTNVTIFEALNNPNLNCIQVDDPVYSSANWLNKDAGTAFDTNSCTVFTLIPDSNFEQALIDQNIDSDGTINGQVLTSNISSLSTLTIQSANIMDATGIEDFISLTGLTLKGNANLTSIDVSNLTQLVVLDLRNNNLSSLDVSNITSLLDLRAQGNQLTTIDLSSNTQLNNVLLQANALERLNIKNGTNTNITGSNFQAQNNPNLTCIQVDDALYSAINWTNIDGGPLTVYGTVSCAITLITDPNFEQALIDLNIDSDGIINGQVFTRDINTRTTLNAINKNISDVTGIEDFVALRNLDLSDNNLTSIDISTLQQLINFDASNNTVLTSFIHLNNPNIKTLKLSNTDISTIDVSPFNLLEELYLTETSIVQLDVSSNTNLIILSAEVTNISQLDVSNNSDLETLRVGYTLLTTLDVSNNTTLRIINARNTLLTELDLSNNNVIDKITVPNCPNLSSLNVKTEVHSQFISFFDALNNPNLSCIVVKNPGYCTTNWTNIDPGTVFRGVSCAVTLIPDPNFEQALIDLGFDSDGVINGQVFTSDINTITTLQIPNKNISDATGIEDFVALEVLRMKGNTLSFIDISNLQQLRIINLQNNISLANFIRGNHPNTKKIFIDNTSLNTLDATMFPLLENLTVTGTPLSQLDVTNCPNLITLDISNSSLSQIDVSNNINLDIFISNNSLLSELDLSNNSNITEITIFECSNFSALNLKNGNNILVRVFKAQLNPNLYCIQVDNAIYSTNNWANIDAGTVFSEVSCAITLIPDANFEQALIDLSIDSDGVINGQVFTDDINTLTNLNVATKNISDLTGIEDFVALTSLICYTNNLSVLDVSANTNLATLQCHDNILDSIDVSMLSGLVTFYPANNNLTSIDVRANLLLKNFNLQNNAIGSLDVSNNTALVRLQAHHLSISELDLTNNPDLTGIFVYNNTNLSSLNIKSGSNTAVIDFNANNNPNLSCIQVDDAAYSTTNWTNINGGTSFSEGCIVLSNSQVELHGVAIYPNPTKGLISIKGVHDIQFVELFNMNGQRVKYIENTIDQIDVHSLQSGVYFMRITTLNGFAIKRIIKQ